MNEKTERRRRVAMVRQIERFPQVVEEIHLDTYRVGFGQYSVSTEDLRFIDDKSRAMVNSYARIRRELRPLFDSTNPSDESVNKFNEVYRAFEREAGSCFDGLARLRMHLAQGVEIPVEGGGTEPLTFRFIYDAIDIDQPKHILKMAVEQIVELFPVDEVEEARHADGTVIEEYIVGDVFENITNSSIISRSHVENAFNRTQQELGNEVAAAILEIAKYVHQSGNPAAGAVFDQFVTEVDQDKPDKSRLRKLWDGVVAILPDVAKLAGAGAAIATLF